METSMSAERAPILFADDDAGSGPLLIVFPSWIGDTIMAGPAVRAIRKRLPALKMVGLVKPGLDELLEGTGWCDAVVAAPSRGPVAISRAIRRIRPRAALLLPNSFRSALCTWLARVPMRIGYARDGRGWLLTHRVPAERTRLPTSAVPDYARLAQAVLGVDYIDERIELACSSAQHEQAERILPRGEVRGKLIVLNPGANRVDKRWPCERFAAVGNALMDAHNAAIAVTGSPAERELVSSICAQCRRPGAFINLIDRGVTLGALKSIIERADLLITNDTGPRHIALALGTPVVSLFGPTDYRWTRIEHVREHVLLAEPFLPEELVADEHPEACAIDRIAVGDVVRAAKAMLGAGKTENGA